MPAPVSQQAPLVQPQMLVASVQQVPPATQSAEHAHPCEPVPPHALAHEPWTTQVGTMPLPCRVQSVFAGHVLIVDHGPALAEDSALVQTVGDVPLQPGVKSCCWMSAPLHW